MSYAPLALRESLAKNRSKQLPNLYVLVMSATMRVVIALQLFAAVGSLEMQRRQALQGLALGVATAAAPAHAGGAVVSDEVSVTFKERRSECSSTASFTRRRRFRVMPSF